MFAFALLLSVVLFQLVRDRHRRSHPDAAFKAITGRSLPPGVRSIAYTHKMTDNLFHTTHYWLLEGSPSALRQVTNGTGFQESLEDALIVASELHPLFGVTWPAKEIVAGYEWELDRDRWYCIFAGETNAVYAH
jgi:hypothetical protein